MYLYVSSLLAHARVYVWMCTGMRAYHVEVRTSVDSGGGGEGGWIFPPRLASDVFVCLEHGADLYRREQRWHFGLYSGQPNLLRCNESSVSPFFMLFSGEWGCSNPSAAPSFMTEK